MGMIEQEDFISLNMYALNTELKDIIGQMKLTDI